MGSRFGGVCYGTNTEAASVMWSGVAPVVSQGSPPFVTTVEFDAGWKLVTRQAGVVVEVQASPDVRFDDCSTLEPLVDGAAVAFMVAGCWLAAWAFVVVRRALR